MKYQIHTFGCKVNTYDTGLIQRNMGQHGFQLDESSLSGDIHILNTCAVTQEATKEAVRVIRRIKASDPLAIIVVTGCAAQVDPQVFAALPFVDLVVANSHKGLLPFILDQYFKGVRETKVYKSNIFRKDDLEPGGGIEEKHSRAFLKIQDGCNSFCSYCIIPYARGKSRSIPISELVRRVNELYQFGYQEVVLTGVHIGDYVEKAQGKLVKGLEDLVEELLLKTPMPRFRLTSLEPLELTERLLDLYGNDRMCPHFHVSVQNVESSVLKAMKRNYAQDDVVDALLKIHQRLPKAFVGIDVIVGFPGESEENFEENKRIFSQTPWTKLHVFPYSERLGTPATLLEKSVPVHERKRRSSVLRNISYHRMQSEALKQVGDEKKILPLRHRRDPQSKHWTGLSRDFWPVRIREDNSLLAEVGHREMTIKIHGVDTKSASSNMSTSFVNSGDIVLLGGGL